MEKLANVSRKVFGKLHLPPLVSRELELAVRKSWPTMDPHEYGYIPYFTATIAFLAVMPLIFVFGRLIGLLIAFMAALAGFLTPILIPFMRVSSAASQIDARLAGLTGFLSIVAHSVPLVDELVYLAARGEPPGSPLRRVLAYVLYRIRVLGEPPVQALLEAAEVSPSMHLATLLRGIARTLETLGDVPGYLEREFESLLAEKARRVERTLAPLTYMVEIYILLVMLSPLIFFLIAFVGTALGAQGIDPRLMLLFFMVVFVPVGTLVLGTMTGRALEEVETL